MLDFMSRCKIFTNFKRNLQNPQTNLFDYPHLTYYYVSSSSENINKLVYYKYSRKNNFIIFEKHFNCFPIRLFYQIYFLWCILYLQYESSKVSF